MASTNTDQLSIAQTLREVLERLGRLERGTDRPQGNRQNTQRTNKTCFICNSNIFSNSVLGTDPLRQELARWVEI